MDFDPGPQWWCTTHRALVRRWIWKAAGVDLKDKIVFPCHRGWLSGQCLDRTTTGQSGQPSVEVVKVSSVLVDVTLHLVDIPAPAGEDAADGGAGDRPPFVRQAAWADLDFCDSMVGGPTFVFLDGAEGIMDPGMLPLGWCPRPLLRWRPRLTLLGWRPRPILLGRRPRPLLRWRPRPLLRWRPRLC